MANLMIDQVRNVDKTTGARYSNETKMFSTSLAFISSRGHKFLRSYLKMPTDRSVRRYVSTSNFQEGINNVTIEALKVVSKDMSEKDRVCCACLQIIVCFILFYKLKFTSMHLFMHLKMIFSYCSLVPENSYYLRILEIFA